MFCVVHVWLLQESKGIGVENRSTDEKEILFGSYVLHGSPFLSSWMPSKKEFEAPVECSCEIIFRFCERAIGNQF
jgi:hypothetical protein